MERATILGIYDYIGYSLCRSLLDQGVEINGIFPKGMKEDYFTEEKRLEIGRNANFMESGLQEWNRKEDFLFVTLFESLQSRHIPDDFLEALLSELEDRQLKKLPTAVILPADFAQDEVELSEREASMSKLVNSGKSNFLTIYLPTIYGPWQPEECFFQQVMSQPSSDNRKMPKIGPREWTHDCLYIDDAVKMIKNMAESGHHGQYILSSGEHDRWLQCARELLGDDTALITNDAGAPVFRDSIQVRKVEQNEQISKGLSRQKEQFRRILDSRV